MRHLIFLFKSTQRVFNSFRLKANKNGTYYIEKESVEFYKKFSQIILSSQPGLFVQKNDIGTITENFIHTDLILATPSFNTQKACRKNGTSIGGLTAEQIQQKIKATALENLLTHRQKEALEDYQ